MRRRARSRPGPDVAVLRIGHRAGRDPRLTTHLALAARALGARAMYLHPPDPALVDRLNAVRSRWGGSFEVVGVPDWRPIVRAHRDRTVHLTMYGEPIDHAIPGLRGRRSLLIVVGGAKVPPDLFQLATWNVAVGAQPHSEVSALAVLLDRLGGVPTGRRFTGARTRIVPQARGKRVRGAGAR